MLDTVPKEVLFILVKKLFLQDLLALHCICRKMNAKLLAMDYSIWQPLCLDWCPEKLRCHREQVLYLSVDDHYDGVFKKFYLTNHLKPWNSVTQMLIINWLLFHIKRMQTGYASHFTVFLNCSDTCLQLPYVTQSIAVDIGSTKKMNELNPSIFDDMIILTFVGPFVEYDRYIEQDNLHHTRYEVYSLVRTKVNDSFKEIILPVYHDTTISHPIQDLLIGNFLAPHIYSVQQIDFKISIATLIEHCFDIDSNFQ